MSREFLHKWKRLIDCRAHEWTPKAHGDLPLTCYAGLYVLQQTSLYLKVGETICWRKWVTRIGPCPWLLEGCLCFLSTIRWTDLRIIVLCLASDSKTETSGQGLLSDTMRQVSPLVGCLCQVLGHGDRRCNRWGSCACIVQPLVLFPDDTGNEFMVFAKW